MKFAWDNYKQYALGKNELRPLTKNGHIGNMFGEWGSSPCNSTFPGVLKGSCAGQLLSLHCREVSVTAAAGGSCHPHSVGVQVLLHITSRTFWGDLPDLLCVDPNPNPAQLWGLRCEGGKCEGGKGIRCL